jgi:hypothetical protein
MWAAAQEAVRGPFAISKMPLPRSTFFLFTSGIQLLASSDPQKCDQHFLFFLQLFFGITQEWQTYKDLCMRFSTSYTRTQATRCGNTFAFVCFDFRVRLGTWHSPTSPKVSTDLGYCQKMYPTIQCNCSACNMPPRMQGYRKEPTFQH